MIGITRDVSLDVSSDSYSELLVMPSVGMSWVCRADMTARESRKSPSVNSGFS